MQNSQTSRYIKPAATSEEVGTFAVQAGGVLTPKPRTLESSPIKSEQLYPHVYSGETSEAALLYSVQAGIADLDLAISAFSSADLISISSRVSLLAASMLAAHRHSGFNEALGALISQIRRAALSLGVDDLDMAKLMLLKRTLADIHREPLMDLMRAADLAIELDSAGLTGQLPGVDTMLALLLEEQVAEAQSVLSFDQ